MKPTTIAALVLVAFIGTLTVFKSVQAPNKKQTYRVSNTTVQIAVGRNTAQIADASYRLAHHSKMIVLETLVITKKSINLVFDAAIESL